MQKKVLFSALIAATAILSGCSKKEVDLEPKPFLEGVIINNGAKCVGKRLHAIAYDANWDQISIADTIVKADKSFVILLPEQPSSEFLTPMYEEEDGLPVGVKISKQDAQTFDIELSLQDNSKEIGYVEYSYVNEDETIVVDSQIIYADSDFSVTGSYIETYDIYGVEWIYNYSYNTNLKKGWNIIYIEVKQQESEKKIVYDINYTTTAAYDLTWNAVLYSSYSMNVAEKHKIKPFAFSKLK